MRSESNKFLNTYRVSGLADSITGAFEIPNAFGRGKLRCTSENKECDRVTVAVVDDKPRRPTYDELDYIKTLFFKGDEIACVFFKGVQDGADPFLVTLIRPHDGIVHL